MKKIKSALLVACGVGLLLGCQVNAEEETEPVSEFEVGTRMNPYKFGEEVAVNGIESTYDDETMGIDVSFTFEDVVDYESISELCPAFADYFSEDDEILYAIGTFHTNGAITDNDLFRIPGLTDLDFLFYDSEMDYLTGLFDIYEDYSDEYGLGIYDYLSYTDYKFVAAIEYYPEYGYMGLAIRYINVDGEEIIQWVSLEDHTEIFDELAIEYETETESEWWETETETESESEY